MSGTVKKEYIKEFEKTEKLGLIATVEECGDPHISLLTTVMAADEKTMVVGQFSQGRSKQNMMARPKTGFAIISLDMNMWRGTFNWREVKTEGPEYVKYNNMQMWRFNTYFGIEKVHYGDLVEISDKAKLNFPGIGAGIVRVTANKKKYLSGKKEEVMRPFAVKIFNGLANPKFACFVNGDGYPVLVPVIQAQAAGSDRIVFTAKPYAEMFDGLKKGERVAVMSMTMQMESILVKGTFSGFENGIGYVDIDRVYNSMPPISGYIYPAEDYKAVEEF